MRRGKRVQEAREKEASAHEEQERQVREARAEEEQTEQEGEVEAQGGHEDEVKAQGGLESEVKAHDGQEEEDANSLREECHVSNRHMTWWHNAWWVRVNNGPHLRTARDRRKVWRAATRAAQEVRETGRVVGGEKERRETGSKESNTLHLVFHFPNATNFNPTAAAATAAATAATRTSNEYYNENHGDRYVPGVILMNLEPGTMDGICAGPFRRLLRVQSSSTLCWMW